MAGTEHAEVGDAQRVDPERDEVQSLMAASRLLTAIVAHTLADAQASVTTPQLRILVMLSSRGALNLAGVAQGLGVNPSNASRTCEQLVTAGLVTRRDHPDDRRNVILTLTPEGARLVERLMDLRSRLFQEVTDAMSEEDRRALATGLEAFVRAAGEVATSEVLDEDDGRLLRWLA